MLRLVVAPALLLAAGIAAATQNTQQPEPRVLLFSKTAGYRHSSIEAGIAAIRKLGQENGFSVEATEDAGAFSERNLRRFRAVVFLNTTGDVLDPRQQDAFERYIQAGGGWVGIHSATDTEYDWPWYGRLAGAYFASHPNNPNVRKGTFRVLDKSHPSTEGLPDRWEREDEFYNFKSISRDVRVLVDIDEKSYQGGTHGDRHPMSWYHAYDGGRAFYTNMGHTEATYSEPLFLRHLLGGLRYAMGTGALDYRRARPEENRFTKVVLAEKLNEPVELAVLPDGERVLFIERRGAVNLYSPATQRYTRIATIPVSTKYLNGNDAEDGLLGLAADPSFASNGWIYLYYSPAGPDPKNVLARYTMKGDSLDLASAKIILEVPVQRDECCHTGGSIAFDRDGNLYVSTGDNTNPFGTGYAPIDERPGRAPWDAQKSSSNTNDLRGKILRIRPQADGSYTIPDGNLFPEAGLTPRTRPEIYTMGHRNPYRIAVDKRTGFVYWGDVGPDASLDSAERGPAGHDEIGQARRAGNFGWPYFVADNKAYFDVDFATMKARGQFDPARPVNRSRNNTGLNELPPAQKAFIWYPYGPSAEFPALGDGGRTAMAGPVYYRDDFRNAARPFPEYYDRKLFIYEWMRGWIIAVTMNANGDYVSMERFMASHKFANPIDMEFAPSGDLYLLEYGTKWFQGNEDARLVRIEYNAGNRTPVVAAAVNRAAGATPLRVELSSAGTIDLDEDELRYEWTISRRDGTVLRRLAQPNPSFTFARPGAHTASLVVTDAQGARDSAQVEIAAGNEPPRVEIDLEGSNRSLFFAGVALPYAVPVDHRENG
jgi:cytochrome c